MPNQPATIFEKIYKILDATDEAYEGKLSEFLDNAKRIFVAGSGRSGLVAKFFAMRLMHSGYSVFVVGEIVTPSIRAGDLLLVISGSGKTETIMTYAKQAHQQGAKIVSISMTAACPLAEITDTTFQIGKPELYSTTVGMPMGTAFELATLMFLEASISHIIQEKGIPEEDMRTRHANLE
jgi:6-phospho-3-hexuloisomerase